LTDRLGFWTIDGETTRWIGVFFMAVGGLYSVIRHPSYLGLLVSSLGWGLAFRSGVGVLLALVLVAPIIARMNSEERLLQSEFGGAYDAYRAQTRRLFPGIY
jgi:protein-S-isoprenylcysteine O-methyltransferase Ste14